MRPHYSSLVLYRPIPTENPISALYAQSVQAGFPSPAADYMEEDINLQDYLMPRPNATFIMRVQGHSMTDAHIPDGALLVVDRSIKPSNNKIVVAVIDGEITVKRLITNSSGTRLMPANAKFQPILINGEQDVRIWGTVTKVIIDTMYI